MNKGRGFFSAVFSSTWNSLGSWINTYDAVDPRNQTMRGVIARPASAADLVTSIPYIRNLCRNYERNNATVRAATEGLVANIVGSGIYIEPDTGDPDTDEKIRAEWLDYIRDCFMNGMGLYEAETLACREVIVAGEALWRPIIDMERVKAGRIPLCFLPLEPEWLGDSGQTIVGNNEGYVGGITLDDYARPVTYNLTTPSGKTERVPAKMMIHIFEKRRSLQIRGEPWFAPILNTLHQEKDLVVAELEAAKNTAGYAAAITTNGGIPYDVDEKGSPTRDINIGSVLELQPGENIQLLSHTRPSQQIKPFRDMLRGDESGALRIGRRWLDRDIGNANYSSMRADMMDNDRLLGPVRTWFGNQSAGMVYKMVLPYLAIKAGVKLPRNNYRLVPDGQPYVDPLKDAQAAASNIAFGLSTYEIEIGKRGGDYKAIWKKLAEEKALAEKLGIVLNDPSGGVFGEQTAEGQENIDENTSDQSKNKNKPSNKPPQGERHMTKSEFLEVMTRLDSERKQVVQPQPSVTLVNETRMDANTAAIMGKAIGEAIPKPEAPIVNVDPAQITVEQPEIKVDVAAPTVNVAAPEVLVDVAAPTVNVAAPQVKIDNEVKVPRGKVIARPNNDGSVTMTPVED
jgi:lambda family phage portal protein